MATQKKSGSGTELRDRSWALINGSVLDLPPRFISDMTEEGELITNTAINGLIRTQKGYYRLAEDVRDGTQVLLHSYERDLLEGRRQNGEVKIKPVSDDNDYHVYGISARKGVRGMMFRDDMNHDMRFLDRAFQKDLNLHTQSMEIGKGNKSHVVKFANGRGAFGIFEMPGGKWRVRYYRNLRRGQDPAERFTRVEETAPDSFFGRLFSLGRDVQEFNNYPDALKYVRKEWNVMSRQIYQGKPVEYESSNLRVRLLARTLDFFDQKKYRDWVVAGVVGLASAVVAAPLAGGALGTALIAGVGSMGWVFGGKAVEGFLYEKWLKHSSARDSKKMEHLRPYFERNDIENYLIKTPENEARFRRKIDPKLISSLRLLDHEEAGINYDDGQFTPNKNPQRPLEDLSSTAFRYFGALFDASQYDRGLLAALYPNGLVTLTQVDQKTHATRHYMSYRADFNEQAGTKVRQTDPGLGNLPSPGPIHKITHKQGRTFGYVGMTPEEFMGDLMHKVGSDAKNMQFFGMKLTDLFNVKGADKIRPETKDSQTLEEIRQAQEIAEAKTTTAAQTQVPAQKLPQRA